MKETTIDRAKEKGKPDQGKVEDVKFQLIPGGETVPGPGELHLRPCVPGSRFDRRLALLMMERGPEAFAQGVGPIQKILVQADPTLDDMLAVTFLLQLLAGERLAAGCRAFALHAAEVREGLKSTALPLHDSLEGIYLAIRSEAGIDLGQMEDGQQFLADWSRLATRIMEAAQAGHNPHSTPLFANDPEFFRARTYLTHDEDVYRQQDVPGGDRWRVFLPGTPAERAGLILRQPRSRLWKYWAREDPQAPGGKGYHFLGVFERPHHWRFSTDPVQRVRIDSLAGVLQQEEETADPCGAGKDRWYDGCRHGYTLVAAPHAGTRLSDDQVLAAVRCWARGEPVVAGTAAAAPVHAEAAAMGTVLEWVDQIALRFDSAWRTGNPPRIADFLDGIFGDRRAALLLELVKIDMERHCTRGTPRSFDDYLAEFPELQDLDRSPPAKLIEHEKSLRPSHIGKYPVVKELGGGGQAKVYLGIHPTLGIQVAIKLSRGMSLGGGADVCNQVRSEGRILAELDHPNLARVYDLDIHHGRAFLVMEFVLGRNLAQASKEKKFTPQQAANLLAQVARAVAILHQKGIIHQDLKPQNLVLDDRGRPRIIDFGLARIRQAWTDELGQPQGGTPAFMAPEQACGEIDLLGPACDIFALGAILYFLLIGQPPFGGSNRAEVLDRVRRCDFDRTALRKAGVSRRLEEICLHALAKVPGDRHSSALDLADDLDQFARRSRKR